MKNISPLLSYLKTTQLSDGSFEHSPFQTSLILVCLEQIKEVSAVQVITRKAASYLLSQVTTQGSWNYWDRTHPKSQLLPDDLDDTSMALAALSIHEPELITEDFLLSFVNLLISTETREGGPYFTWIVPPNLREVWNDLDLVVNSNIHYLLSLHTIHLEPLENYLEELIIQKNLSSKYYSPLHISFFLSKWKTNSKKKDLMRLLVPTYPKITTLLDRALFIIAYLNLDGDPQKVSHDIARLSKIKPGHLDADPFYVEEIEEGVPVYAGSSSLTAAYIIQALVLYEHKTQALTSPAQNQHPLLISQVSSLALKYFTNTPHPLHQNLHGLLEKMSTQKKAAEVFLLPLLWYESLHANNQKSFSRDQVMDLCVANILGWIGFGIYDSVIDGEPNQELIPLANLCVREVSEIFHKQTPPDNYPDIRNILDTIDHAQVWEQHYCRIKKINGVLALPQILPDYKNYTQLAYKSLGHGLGPIILTLPKKRLVQQFFTHYLIARQLNDDAHDWLEDLEQGALNPVSVRIIKRLKELNPAQDHINLVTDRELLQSLFWYEIIDTVADEILFHTKQARVVIKKLRIFKDTTITDLTLLPLEESAQQALAERDSAVRFLEKYH